MISFRIDTNLLDKLDKLSKSKTDVIHKSLEMYIQSQENVNTKRNTNVNTVKKFSQKRNRCQQEKISQMVNHMVDHQINYKAQVVEHYELLRHYKEEIDWLRNRVEYFEKLYSDLQNMKSTIEKESRASKSTLVSNKEPKNSSEKWFRM
jgi:hypothetical protein